MSGTTYSRVATVDALLVAIFAKQGVKARKGAVKSPLIHILPYGDDFHDATRTA